MLNKTLNTKSIIPGEAGQGTWIGRCQVPASLAYKGIAGPHVVQVKDGQVYDLSEYFNATSELINHDNPLGVIEEYQDSFPCIGDLQDILHNSVFAQRDEAHPYLLSPNDTQAIKACGVTFIQSLLERVIEEKSQGDAARAYEIRTTLVSRIGSNLNAIVPGSDKAQKLKAELQEQGIWSQYLEVGIGKDAEIFTKSQPLSAVGFGAEIGVLKSSGWNNPEPEVVLAVSNKGEIKGATLGNDVNLRGYEGRSALLLGEAKDQNGSCSIGPLIRLFDESFQLETLKREAITLNIEGEDGFSLEATSDMAKISRSPEVLVGQAIGENHQYPDGLVLFCGTMFAPTKDRGKEGLGFTHKVGDQVVIQSKHLGSLINWVNTCDQIPKWEFGISAYIDYRIKRNG